MEIIGDVTFDLLAFTIISGTVLVAIVARKYKDRTDLGFSISDFPTFFLGADTVRRVTEDAQDVVDVLDLIDRGG